ncbi:elongator complex protein 1 [Venturia nashicola]|uniref:Elongator complex protein 1 n=1 Tax=Venturia nashicola TaxID=86259 RepID=A0A4Z1P0M6_9PEZI|nr:elongator complex protein 1 [Venturia nashicola]
MKNLRNIQRSTLQFPESEIPLTATAWDTSNDTLISAFGPTETNALIELRRSPFFPSKEQPSQLIASWEAPCPHPDLVCDKILNLHYFSDTSVACLILEGGDIVIVREAPLPEEDLLEIVGSVDAGIEAAAWSPDEELLTIVTKAGTLLFMSKDFENVADVAFEAEDVKASNHVNVGWGKKETQFQGKRAKALRDPTMPERVDEGVLSAKDDKKICISWRGDGAFVAVNSVEAGTRRMIRVYSREGTLDSVSEPTDCLEGSISWRPAGNLIAGVKRTDDQAQIVFFERNGLRHGNFDLRMTKDELGKPGTINLHWNVDSTVLAVCFDNKIQLWTMGNYHYYLKQEIIFSALSACWHPEKSLRLAIHSKDHALLLDYAFSVSKGSTNGPHDYGTLAVIDGSSLKLTPMRAANVPPPMALHELKLDDHIVDVAINSAISQVVVLSRTSISLYSYGAFPKQFSSPELISTHPLPANSGTPSQISLCGNEFVAVSTHQGDVNEDQLFVWSKDSSEWTYIEIGMGHLATISTSSDFKTFCIQAQKGLVLQAGPESGALKLIGEVKLPTFCPWIEVATVGDQEITFGLSTSGSLYANHLLLASNCTSFLTTDAHLIFTTTHHLLKFVHLTSADDLEVPPNEPEKDERCRSIERGARLITVMPTSYSLVLQMPRGNLETIYPRALVLAGIRRSIEVKKYKKAFLACRNQRVDMNILHDHAPQQFMENVALFVEQIKKVEHIDLFLSSLREEDVSQTMYKETIQKRQSEALTNGHLNPTPTPTNNTEATLLVPKSKINGICDAFLAALQLHKSTNLQNIITASVSKSPPDLEGGLTVISGLREQDEAIAEKAAEHICFLADVNKLYETALGMYDLDLALLIAQQSQKDPREYLPYMQSLQEMTLLRKKFTIDNDLARHEKALGHLHDLDAFEELEGYCQRHELYAQAIELYKYKTEKLDALMRLYASFLESRNRYKEAGIAYEYLSDHVSALPCYRQASLWQEALSSASMIPIPENEMQELGESLAEGLVESKEFSAAATIYTDYLSNIPEACRNLCKAYQFSEASRLITLDRKPELLESVLDVGLMDAFNSTTELLSDCKSQIVAQVPRLRDLRIKKEKDPLAFYAGDRAENEGGQDFPDNISLASTSASTSGGTFMTRYTNRTGTTGTFNTATTRKTSKNRRREERKRARGKKGSVYEEEYLINSIGRLIERVNNTGEEVGRLVEALLRRGMRERGMSIERAMIEVVGLCEAIIGEVWVQSRKIEADFDIAGGEGIDEAGKPVGADAVLWEAMNGIGISTAPIIKKFQKVGLLG